MAVNYFKRFRMEMDLRQLPRDIPTPCPYRFVAWHPELLEVHADVKYRSFRWEIDSNVFSCLGDLAGCYQLMLEISQREGFVPEATWLVGWDHADGTTEYCGTIQGICDQHGWGSIQNVGTVPEHRRHGIASALVRHALTGFRQVGLPRAYLEVTAQNTSAIRLYRSLGFRQTRTLYKAVEVACT